MKAYLPKPLRLIAQSLLVLCLACACSSDEYFYDNSGNGGNSGGGRDKNPPSVTTGNVSMVNGNAIIKGSVVSDGSHTATEWGICLGETPTPTEKVKDTSANKAQFSVVVKNLASGTTYYYRAYAVNRYGISYGAEQSFQPASIPPTVLTEPTVATTNARGQSMAIEAEGAVTDDGGITVTERGFLYSTTANVTIDNGTKVTVGLNGSFSVRISGLAQDTDYYIRAYAINEVGIGYGDEKMVTATSCSAFTLPFSMDFTSESAFPPPCWSMIDYDGDGSGWFRNSYSAFNDKFGALSIANDNNTTHNLLITPKIRISGTNPTAYWKVRTTSLTLFADHYKLVISEVPITNANCENPSIVKTLFEETLTTYDYYDWAMWWSEREYVHLTDYVGKDVYLAWVHYNNGSNANGLYITDIELYNSNIPTPTMPFTETFSNGMQRFPPSGWGLMDFNTSAGGWYYGWNEAMGGPIAASSSSSESIWNMIRTPQLLISGSTPTLSWTVMASNQYKPNENYKVVVSEVPITESNARDRNVVKTVFEETLTAAAVTVPQNRSVNLSAYTGKPVYIAWVHYDCMQGSLRLANIQLNP